MYKLSLPQAAIFDWDETIAQTSALTIEAIEKTIPFFRKTYYEWKANQPLSPKGDSL